MGKYRTAELLAAKSITTAGTETLEIKTRDVISRLSIIVRLTNSSYVPTQHPARAITTITLQDGSNVLHSMRGIYSQSLAHYGTGKTPHNYLGYIDNGKATSVIPIYFGRRLWDEELALAPDRFNNLILNIAHNYLAGGAVPDAATLEVWADLFDEKPVNPVGFLKGSTHWSKTLVASTIDYVDLPTDLPIRLVMPAVSSSSEEPDINIASVKITEDGDKKILTDISGAHQIRLHESQYPAFEEMMEARAFTTAEEYYVTPAKNVLFIPMSSADNDAYWNSLWSGGQQRQIVASANGINFNALVTGRCPHGVIPFPMGVQDDMSDWWEVSSGGSRRIRMTTGAGDTSALYELLIQELMRY